MPALRAYAKRIVNTEDAACFLSALPHRYLEENHLHAALLEYVKDADSACHALETFLPYLDNWATCDSFCPKVLRNSPALLWERILVWLSANEPYTVRFALVRLTAWYLDSPLFSEAVLQAALLPTQQDYYVRMAQAWLFSIALVKQYDTALPYLTDRKLPVWIHNKAIQKAVESYRIPPARKQELKALRRTEKGDRKD